MQTGVNNQRKDGGTMVRQRSVSNVADGRAGNSNQSSPDSYTNATDLRRSNTTGKRITEGLKRRFGSIRRKKAEDSGS
jgi:hypothetical protein